MTRWLEVRVTGERCRLNFKPGRPAHGSSQFSDYIHRAYHFRIYSTLGRDMAASFQFRHGLRPPAIDNVLMNRYYWLLSCKSYPKPVIKPRKTNPVRFVATSRLIVRAINRRRSSVPILSEYGSCRKRLGYSHLPRLASGESPRSR